MDSTSGEYPYDVNFCFPVRDLENSRIRLTPFVPKLHAEEYFAQTSPHPELYDKLPIGPYSGAKQFVVEVIEKRVQPNPGIIVFAVIVKQQSHNGLAQPIEEGRDEQMAGIVGLLNTEPDHLTTEMGYVLTFPAFQHTHVRTDAIGLLLSYCLDLPVDGGMALRRVQWQAGPDNPASVRVAEKMGFKREALLRWQRPFLVGKQGNPGRSGEPEITRDKPGVDSLVIAVCWDDWIVDRPRIQGMLYNDRF